MNITIVLTMFDAFFDLSLCLSAFMSIRPQFKTPEEFFRNSKQPLHCNRALAVLGPSWTELVSSNQASAPTLTVLNM